MAGAAARGSGALLAVSGASGCPPRVSAGGEWRARRRGAAGSRGCTHLGRPGVGVVVVRDGGHPWGAGGGSAVRQGAEVGFVCLVNFLSLA